jgi:acyl-CoA synthetase (AMP-forming)/AMP-acid ligase II
MEARSVNLAFGRWKIERRWALADAGDNARKEAAGSEEGPRLMWAYPEIRLIGDTVAYYARHEPERLAFVHSDRRTTFGELERLANRLAHGLLRQGVAGGDRVFFFGKNSLDFYLALFGAAKAGACFVPLNWRLAAAELADVVRDADGRLAIVERESQALWIEICRLGAIEIETIVIDAAATLENWCATQPEEPPKTPIREDDPVILLYTSGTTGAPKGVVHTHASFNHSRLSEHFERAYDWRDGDLFLCPLPNFHLLHIALSLQCLYNGVAISIQRQFDPAALLAGIESQRPSLLVLTPTMIQLMLDHPNAKSTNFESVRLRMYAGSPISLGLIKFAISMMPGKFMQFYGQTETSGPVSLLRPDEHNLADENKLKSCGPRLPLSGGGFVAAAGGDAPDGQPGELLVGAPAASAGYWRRPDQTGARFKDGWYHSGDIAYRDAEGLFYIHDRVHDMIVTGGENVYSTEVESVLSLHPSVAAVAVIGVPHERWGEAIKAIVVFRQGQFAESSELMTFCRARLAGYKTPKSVDVVDALPLTGTGKVSKMTLRAKYWTNMSRSVA